jgi:BolA protein
MTNQRTYTMHERLSSALHPTQLEIIDESAAHAGHAGAASGHGHFAANIASPLFQNKTTLQCHRMVYEALGELMQTDIHAIRITIIK